MRLDAYSPVAERLESTGTIARCWFGAQSRPMTVAKHNQEDALSR
jgi:hypothetical protein